MLIVSLGSLDYYPGGPVLQLIEVLKVMSG
jgi:hypothetical protein